jgi:hypothetical protein
MYGLQRPATPDRDGSEDGKSGVMGGVLEVDSDFGELGGRSLATLARPEVSALLCCP